MVVKKRSGPMEISSSSTSTSNKKSQGLLPLHEMTTTASKSSFQDQQQQRYEEYRVNRSQSAASTQSTSSTRSNSVSPRIRKTMSQPDNHAYMMNSGQSYLHSTNNCQYHSGSSNAGSSNHSREGSDLPTNLPQLPNWSANPQSPNEDPSSPNRSNSPMQHLPYNHSSPSSHYSLRHSNRRHWWASVAVAVVVLAALAVCFQSRQSLLESLDEVDELSRQGQSLQSDMTNAEKSIKMLQREISALDVMFHGAAIVPQQIAPELQEVVVKKPKVNGVRKVDRNDPDATARRQHHRALQEMQLLSDKLKISAAKAKSLKTQVQALSKKEAIAKYGNKRYRVEIDLAFPNSNTGSTHAFRANSAGEDMPHKFVIELAPIDLMPHSVHFFLEMVNSGLLDGCSFILNALHVLKAAPLPYDGSSAAEKARAFTREGLESVAFKEYTDDFPHKQYTVGFAADGSPSFYINTEDNSEIHIGDPCFGKIVEGLDAVKRLEASPTRNGIWFEQRIGIRKATVLP